MNILSKLMVPALLVAAVGVAHAGGKEGTIGVGGEVGVAGLGNGNLGSGLASIVYDAGVFHVGGFVGLQDGDGADNTNFEIGGQFYYHVHSTLSSDFGIGGRLEIASIDRAAPDDRLTQLYIQPGFQFRTFFNGGNVALSVSGGLTIGAIDAGGLSIGSETNLLAGLHYYFF